MTVDELINVLTDLRDKRGAGKMKLVFHDAKYGDPTDAASINIRVSEHGEKFLDIEGDDVGMFVYYDEDQLGEPIWPN